MKAIKKNTVLFLIFGSIYLNLEVFMRMFRSELVGVRGLTHASLAGWTSVWMLPIGGSCFFIIGYLNEKWKMPLWLQTLLGTITVFSIEMVTGLFFNVWLELNLWGYHDWPLNIMGQITLVYVPVWALLCPVGIWLDDLIRNMYRNSDYQVSLASIYKDLFTGN